MNLPKENERKKKKKKREKISIKLSREKINILDKCNRCKL